MSSSAGFASRTVQRDITLISRVLVVVLALMIVLALVLGFVVVKNIEARQTLKTTLTTLLESAQGLQELDVGVLQHDVARIGQLNSVLAFEGYAVDEMLQTVQSVLPDRVRLVKFTYDAKKGSGTMGAQAVDLDALTQFVDRVESNTHFRKVEVQRQSKLDDAKGILQFDVTFDTAVSAHE